MTDEQIRIAFEALNRSAIAAADAIVKVMKNMRDIAPFNAARLAEALQGLGTANREIKPLLRYAVYAAADNGMPETEIARLAGLDRMTVRSWLGKQLKRGDLVTGVPYYSGTESDEEPITGTYVPRDDHAGARPPLAAAWIDTGEEQGPWMVRRETVRHVKS